VSVRGPGGGGPGEQTLFLRGRGLVAGAAHELVEGVGEVGFAGVGVVPGVVGGRGADVVPGVFVERVVGVVAVDPGDLGELPVGEADPDLPQVVGVDVGFPFSAAGGDGV